MSSSKVIRSLSLLLLFSLFLTGFGSVNVSAATNLINPNISEWDNIGDSTGNYEISCISAENFYILYSTLLGYTGTDGTVPFYFGHIFDKTTLITGESYTFSMHISSPAEIRAGTNYTWSDNLFVTNLGSGWTIGFGVVDKSGNLTYISEFLSITPDNYLSLAGTDYVHSFTCPDYSGGNPCVFFMSSGSWSSSWAFLDKSLMLIDNSEESEESFLTGLFEWFQDRFDDLKTSFTDLSTSIGGFFTSLGDRISTFFTDLGTSISNGLNTVKEGIQTKLEELKTSFTELGESLLQGIQNLFIPDEDYISEWKDDLDKLLQEHFGIIYTSADLIVTLFQEIFDIVLTAPDEYGLTIPEVSFTASDGTEVTIFNETQVSFDFMQNSTFKTLYGLYGIALYIMFGMLEVKYAIRVYRKVMAN